MLTDTKTFLIQMKAKLEDPVPSTIGYATLGLLLT